MISTMNTNVTNALLKFYAHSKSKEEAEKLIEYIDALVNVKAREMMEDYVTKDYLRAELSALSERLTKQFSGMMMKTIFAILIPIVLLLLGLYAKL